MLITIEGRSEEARGYVFDKMVKDTGSALVLMGRDQIIKEIDNLEDKDYFNISRTIFLIDCSSVMSPRLSASKLNKLVSYWISKLLGTGSDVVISIEDIVDIDKRIRFLRPHRIKCAKALNGEVGALVGNYVGGKYLDMSKNLIEQLKEDSK